MKLNELIKEMAREIAKGMSNIMTDKSIKTEPRKIKALLELWNKTTRRYSNLDNITPYQRACLYAYYGLFNASVIALMTYEEIIKFLTSIITRMYKAKQGDWMENE